MRIISGNLKGKSIAFVKSSTTRPLKDSVKESIFNVLIHSNLFNINIKDSNVLDLYSGIGSFGLECISRGSEKVTFVEKDKIAIKILKENLLNLLVQEKGIVMNDEIINYLKIETIKNFNIIFIDPPFAENNFLNELKLIKEKKIFKKNHIIIIHREKNSNDVYEEGFNPIIIKKYGRSKIIFGKFLT